MKLLCIADIHGDMENLEKAAVFARNNKINSVIILGDLSGYGRFRNFEMNRGDAAQALEILKEFEILAVPGNCDSIPTIEFLERKGVSIHEKIKVIEDVSFVGLGGSSPTPFQTPFELSEGEIYDKLKKLLNSVKTKRIILVLHSPPKDTRCDIAGNGSNVGSESVRKIIEEFQPDLVISSHVHESGGMDDSIGKTKVANIGPISMGNIGVIKIKGDISIELRRIK